MNMKLGKGGRFEKLTNKLVKGGHSLESAKAIAASVGMKKYGKKKMVKWSAAGRKK